MSLCTSRRLSHLNNYNPRTGRLLPSTCNMCSWAGAGLPNRCGRRCGQGSMLAPDRGVAAPSVVSAPPEHDSVCGLSLGPMLSGLQLTLLGVDELTARDRSRVYLHFFLCHPSDVHRVTQLHLQWRHCCEQQLGELICRGTSRDRYPLLLAVSAMSKHAIVEARPHSAISRLAKTLALYSKALRVFIRLYLPRSYSGTAGLELR